MLPELYWPWTLQCHMKERKAPIVAWTVQRLSQVWIGFSPDHLLNPSMYSLYGEQEVIFPSQSKLHFLVCFLVTEEIAASFPSKDCIGRVLWRVESFYTFMLMSRSLQSNSHFSEHFLCHVVLNVEQKQSLILILKNSSFKIILNLVTMSI